MREFMVRICKIVPKYMPEFTKTVRAKAVRNEVQILTSVVIALLCYHALVPKSHMTRREAWVNHALLFNHA